MELCPADAVGSILDGPDAVSDIAEWFFPAIRTSTVTRTQYNVSGFAIPPQDPDDFGIRLRYHIASRSLLVDAMYRERCPVMWFPYSYGVDNDAALCVRLDAGFPTKVGSIFFRRPLRPQAPRRRRWVRQPVWRDLSAHCHVLRTPVGPCHNRSKTDCLSSPAHGLVAILP